MKLNNLARLLVLGGCVCVAMELTAQDAPVAPIQGSVSPVLVTEPSNISVTPDQHPLSGGQSLGIGSWGSRHSFLVPSLRILETYDSNPLLLNTNTGSYTGLSGFGSLKLVQYLGQDAEIRYFGALRYDTKARLQGYSQFTNTQHFAISRTIHFGRWSLLVDDEAQYSQGSSFGDTGMEGTGTIATYASQINSLSNLQTASNSLRLDILPDQSILTGQVGRVTNTALIELDANLNARDTATLAASYGLLHFDSSLLMDTDQVSMVAGYNRRMTARDSIALESAFTRFNYWDSSNSISTEYISALYARRISGRSSMEIGGGPQIAQTLMSQVSGSFLGWQARGSVEYRAHRMNLSARGMHMITGGAGVLGGAISTTGQGAVSFPLSRYWSTSLSAGLSRNQQLNSQQKYDVQFADFALNRRIGTNTNLFMSYDVQRQTTASGCTGPNCGFAGVRNVLGIGLAWDCRPIRVE